MSYIIEESHEGISKLLFMRFITQPNKDDTLYLRGIIVFLASHVIGFITITALEMTKG